MDSHATEVGENSRWAAKLVEGLETRLRVDAKRRRPSMTAGPTINKSTTPFNTYGTNKTR